LQNPIAEFDLAGKS